MALGTGLANTGNAVSPWQTETERKTANNAALAPYGLSADSSPKLFDANNNYVKPQASADGMGGVFNPNGMSNNPYYLQGTVGVNRSQLAGTGLENISDKALASAYNVNSAGNRTFANDLWVNSDGSISSMQTADSVSVGDIRKALSQMTGQQYVDAWGSAAPFVKPDYYDGSTANTETMGTRQQTLIDTLTKQAVAAYNAAVPQTVETPSGTTETPVTPSQGIDEEELRRYIASLLKAGGKW